MASHWHFPTLSHIIYQYYLAPAAIIITNPNPFSHKIIIIHEQPHQSYSTFPIQHPPPAKVAGAASIPTEKPYKTETATMAPTVPHGECPPRKEKKMTPRSSPKDSPSPTTTISTTAPGPTTMTPTPITPYAPPESINGPCS